MEINLTLEKPTKICILSLHSYKGNEHNCNNNEHQKKPKKTLPVSKNTKNTQIQTQEIQYYIIFKMTLHSL